MAELFKEIGCLIVKSFIFWDNTASDKEVGATAVSFDVLGRFARTEGLDVDVVAANHYHDILGTAFGRNRKTPCEIRVPNKFAKVEKFSVDRF